MNNNPLRNIDTAIDKNYSVKDLMENLFNSRNRPATIITYGQSYFLENLNKNNIKILNSPDKNILNNNEILNPPFLIFIETETTSTLKLEEFKLLFERTNHILLKLPTEAFNKEMDLFSDLVEYLSSMNFSILDIFGGYSAHHWQPDNMFGKIYIAFINNNCNIN